MNSLLRLALALTIAAGLGFACGSTSNVGSEPATDRHERSDNTVAETTVQEHAGTKIPPTVDPAEFAGAEGPVPLPLLGGLTEAEARDWALASGFDNVVRTDGDYPEVLDTTGRVILEVGDDGRVISAIAG